MMVILYAFGANAMYLLASGTVSLKVQDRLVIDL